MQQAYATAAAAAQRQQRWQRAAQAVAAATDRCGGSCGSSGLCRGRVHGGGTCGVWQRRRQRWVWRQHWQRWVCRMPRMVLGHAATAVIALQHRHVAVACVVVWAWHVCVGGGGGVSHIITDAVFLGCVWRPISNHAGPHILCTKYSQEKRFGYWQGVAAM